MRIGLTLFHHAVGNPSEAFLWAVHAALKLLLLYAAKVTVIPKMTSRESV